jgi:hypothetical protein
LQRARRYDELGRRDAGLCNMRQCNRTVDDGYRANDTDHEIKHCSAQLSSVLKISSRGVCLGSRSTACFLRSICSRGLRLLRFGLRSLQRQSARQDMVNGGRKQTFSASSFALASSSARRFSSSASAFESPLPAPALFLRFASRASFSSCLMRLIRGSIERATSTILRRRAVSSFLRRARSVLFFFSVYRLSSRLHVKVN